MAKTASKRQREKDQRKAEVISRRPSVIYRGGKRQFLDTAASAAAVS